MEYKYDVVWRNIRDKTQISKINDIIYDYVVNNLTMKTIAFKYDCPYDTVNAIITKNNIPKKSFSEVRSSPDALKNIKPQKLIDPSELSTVIELYKNGESLNELSKRFNITPRGLTLKLKKNGISIRGYKEAANIPSTYERKKITNLKNNGVENPMQNAAINEKSTINRYRFKAVDIHGKRFSHLQGYEPQGITYLIEQMGIDVDDIYSGRKVPKIRYSFDGKRKMYFPDMFVKSKNLLVEVKCEYTYEDMLDLNNAKKEASLNAGYDYLTIIFDNNGKNISRILQFDILK